MVGTEGEWEVTVEERFPTWCESDKMLCEAVFGRIAKERKELMGDGRYYCEFEFEFRNLLFLGERIRG